MGDPGLIPGLKRSPGEGNGNPVQYSYLENPMDRGAWRATVHGVTKRRTQLTHTHQPTHIHTHTHTRTRARGRAGRGFDWEFGIRSYELMCMEWINNKVLLHSAESYVQYLLIAHMESKNMKKDVYIY